MAQLSSGTTMYSGLEHRKTGSGRGTAQLWNNSVLRFGTTVYSALEHRKTGSGHGTAQLWNNCVLSFGTQKNWIRTWHSSALEQLCTQVWNTEKLDQDVAQPSSGTTLFSGLEHRKTGLGRGTAQLWNNCVFRFGTTVYSALEQLCTQLWNNCVLSFGTTMEQLCTQLWNNCVLSFGTQKNLASVFLSF